MRNSERQARREAQRRRDAQKKVITFGGLGLLAVALVVVIVVFGNKTPASGALMGDAVPITSRDHIPTDQAPVYNSNPPAGGAHFATDFNAGFFQESDLATLPKYPEGYLVHNLEHGYVIFWYNCAATTDCAGLKQTIQQVMDAEGGTKLIAFPWSGMTEPLAMTSWGQILKFSAPDAAKMKQFVERNRYQAPEPNAP